jgi:hypothetical protein
MPKIIDSVIARKNVILNEPDKVNKPEATRTGRLAIAAIHAGAGSPEWAAYMAQFGEITPLDPDQVKRLNAADGTQGDALLDKKRAYLVSNGVCGIQSPDNTLGLDGKVDTIDNGMGGVVCPP